MNITQGIAATGSIQCVGPLHLREAGSGFKHSKILKHVLSIVQTSTTESAIFEQLAPSSSVQAVPWAAPRIHGMIVAASWRKRCHERGCCSTFKKHAAKWANVDTGTQMLANVSGRCVPQLKWSIRSTKICIEPYRGSFNPHHLRHSQIREFHAWSLLGIPGPTECWPVCLRSKWRMWMLCKTCRTALSCVARRCSAHPVKAPVWMNTWNTLDPANSKAK